MQIITLTSDWGYRDHYVGLVKGRLYSTIADCMVVDITHSIPKFNLHAAAFIVKNACFEYPEGTIHIIDVNSYEGENKSFIAVKHRGQYYICTDNGLPKSVFGNDEVEIVQINLYNESNYYTFATLDLFAKVAKHIAEAGTIEHLGVREEGFVNRIVNSAPVVEQNKIRTEVIYIDDYGNAFLNLKADEFARIRGGRKFKIEIAKNRFITDLEQSYADEKGKDDVLLTIRTTGYLQIAIREGNFSEIRCIEVGSSIIIDLLDTLEP